MLRSHNSFPILCSPSKYMVPSNPAGNNFTMVTSKLETFEQQHLNIFPKHNSKHLSFVQSKHLRCSYVQSQHYIIT